MREKPLLIACCSLPQLEAAKLQKEPRRPPLLPRPVNPVACVAEAGDDVAVQVMLFDEVTAALDPEMVKEVLEVIQGLARDGMTLLIVTHEMAFARAVADRVVFMEAGRILEHNTPEAFFTNPQTARAQQFLEKFSFVSTLPKKIKELELI